ncbi:MAG: hypothetical protein NTX79_01010 [Candidatus Micrarchaeota archaeon]|nr:hypothetical protein [Candidatus Micrarchaeota archaeon]
MAQKFASQPAQGAAMPEMPGQIFLTEGEPKKADGRQKSSVSLSVLNGARVYDEARGYDKVVVSNEAVFSFGLEGAGKPDFVYLRRRPAAGAGPEAAKNEPWTTVYSWSRKSKKAEQKPRDKATDTPPSGTYEYVLYVVGSKGSARTEPIPVSVLGEGVALGSISPIKISASLRKDKPHLLDNIKPGFSASSVFYSDNAKRQEGNTVRGDTFFDVNINSLATTVSAVIKTPKEKFVESFAIYVMRSTSWAKGSASYKEPGSLPRDLSGTTNCTMAGVEFKVHMYPNRNFPFIGYASAAAGSEKGKLVYNVHMDAPFLPMDLGRNTKASPRLYVNLGTLSRRVYNDPKGEGVAGAAVEVWPSDNYFIKLYAGFAAFDAPASNKYGPISTSSTIAGIGFSYSTPNGIFSLTLNASTTIASGLGQGHKTETGNSAVSFSIRIIP